MSVLQGLLSAVAALFGASQADDFAVYHTLCMPEMGVFRFEQFTMTPSDYYAASEESRQQSGLRRRDDPSECDLGDRVIRYRTEPGRTDGVEMVFEAGDELLFRFPSVIDDGTTWAAPNHVVQVGTFYAEYCWYADEVYRWMRGGVLEPLEDSAGRSACEVKLIT